MEHLINLLYQQMFPAFRINLTSQKSVLCPVLYYVLGIEYI